MLIKKILVLGIFITRFSFAWDGTLTQMDPEFDLLDLHYAYAHNVSLLDEREDLNGAKQALIGKTVRNGYLNYLIKNDLLGNDQTGVFWINSLKKEFMYAMIFKKDSKNCTIVYKRNSAAVDSKSLVAKLRCKRADRITRALERQRAQ
ncbi:MAG: hypothetical protein CL678_09235 [Bdellovibrionaceae bacterium]|nr:hypothetical protein [Pseudobdellovibrionaceae bacterium]|tara:strand:- start:26 stop:469 length:444 start_codon:yes stop_codon:yes gene_type:complete